ncbi:MAG: beta-galactosidase [Clostridia bacterium]|nr:beta-galactosidase [Clostridia bacterium]
MKQIRVTDSLLPGTSAEGDVLTLPAAGGGFLLPDLTKETYRWLNLDMQVLADHAQAFEARFYAEEEAPRVIIRFGLMPDMPAVFALDLNWLDGHVLFPGHRVGTQKVVCHGSRIERNEIRRAELVSMAAAESVRVRFSSVWLDDVPGPLHAPGEEKLIDTFGQYKKKDWPGKIRTEAECSAFLRAESGKAPAYPFADRTAWGGNASEKLTEGTGYFGKIRKDGRWYLTDPEGCAFFSMGPDCVVARCDARIDGLENLLEDLPSREEAPELYGDGRLSFGETERGRGVLFSYERRNLMRAFGKDWDAAWQRLVTGQLIRMGMNTLGNWSDSRLYGKMPYVTSLPEFPSTKQLIFRDFPDVLAKEYRQEAVRCAEALEERRDDPWMIGYFLRNEPAWAFVDKLLIADEVLRNPEPTACREGLIDFLQERYGTAEALSEAWQTRFASFDELQKPIAKASALSERAMADIREFSAFLTDRYMRIPAEACRAADPNHMILGMRWAWISDPLLVTGWDAFDVFSINCYAVDPTPALDQVRKLGVDLPVMIGEFHFGALDAGLPATGLEAVRNQADRARAYRCYVERVAAAPNGVGCHWFQCYDQFALGRFDGENYNIGLFDITLRPYPELCRAVRETAASVYGIMAGEQMPSEDWPVSLPMIAY